MYPHGASASGFLAPGERLEAVIKKDEETLSRLGTTHDEVAVRLEELINKAKGWNEEGTYEDEDIIVKVSVSRFLGMQECPYSDRDTDFAELVVHALAANIRT